MPKPVVLYCSLCATAKGKVQEIKGKRCPVHKNAGRNWFMNALGIRRRLDKHIKLNREDVDKYTVMLRRQQRVYKEFVTK